MVSLSLVPFVMICDTAMICHRGYNFDTAHARLCSAGVVAPASRRRFCDAAQIQKTPARRRRYRTSPSKAKRGTINPMARSILHCQALRMHRLAGRDANAILANRPSR